MLSGEETLLRAMRGGRAVWVRGAGKVVPGVLGPAGLPGRYDAASMVAALSVAGGRCL